MPNLRHAGRGGHQRAWEECVLGLICLYSAMLMLVGPGGMLSGLVSGFSSRFVCSVLRSVCIGAGQGSAGGTLESFQDVAPGRSRRGERVSNVLA